MNITIKYILGLVLLSTLAATSLAQDSFKPIKVENNKILHGFGIYFNNKMCIPEKFYNEYGLISRKPRFRYGVELGINYNPILYKNLGLNLEVIVLGTSPIGATINDNGNIPDNAMWQNGLKGDIISGNYSGPSKVYWGFNLKLNYSVPVKKYWIIQPEIGVKLPYMPLQYGTVSIRTYSANYVNYYSELEPIKAYSNFYPDLIGGVNFLYKIKGLNKCLKFGVNFDLSFVNRDVENFEIRNLGTHLDSGGDVHYSSSFVGFLIGYQFFGIKNNKKEVKQNNVIFNPRQ